MSSHEQQPQEHSHKDQAMHQPTTPVPPPSSIPFPMGCPYPYPPNYGHFGPFGGTAPYNPPPFPHPPYHGHPSSFPPNPSYNIPPYMYEYGSHQYPTPPVGNNFHQSTSFNQPGSTGGDHAQFSNNVAPSGNAGGGDAFAAAAESVRTINEVDAANARMDAAIMKARVMHMALDAARDYI